MTAALNSVKYAGHVAPGMLLVTAEPCALEILRGAYSRSVLKPPAGMFISYVGKDCIATTFLSLYWFSTSSPGSFERDTREMCPENWRSNFQLALTDIMQKAPARYLVYFTIT